MALDGLDNLVIALRTAARGHHAGLLISLTCYSALLLALVFGNAAEWAGIGGATLALGLSQARRQR